MFYVFFFFFFKQKTAYEMRISDWSSDVCSSDLRSLLIGGNGLWRRAISLDRSLEQHGSVVLVIEGGIGAVAWPVTVLDGLGGGLPMGARRLFGEIGRASCRERVCQYV